MSQTTEIRLAKGASGVPAQERNEIRRTFVILASIAMFCVFYRELLLSGFDKLPGDDGDAFLIMNNLEHWYQLLFRGMGSWLSASNFFPRSNTLGYTEGVFLLGLPYGLARSLNVSLGNSYQFTLVLVHLIGYASCFNFLRSALSLKRIPALLGASMATLNNAFYVSIGHTQLFTIGLIPVSLLLLAAFFRKTDRTNFTRLLAGGGFALLLPLMLYTGYYVTWFLVFYGTIVVAVLFFTDRFARNGAGTVKVWRWLWSNKLETFAYALLGIAAIAPFVATYLPILREIGGRSFDEVRATLPNWFDLVNVGGSNVLWGSLFSQAFPEASTRPLAWELTKGLPPITFLVFCIAGLWSIRTYLYSNRSTPNSVAAKLHGDLMRFTNANPFLVPLAAVLTISVFICWCLLLRVNDYSMWWLVHAFIPGATAIRAVSRFQHVLLFPVAIVIAIAFHTAWEQSRTSPPKFATPFRILLVAVAFLLLAEQLNSGEYYLASKSALLSELRKVSPAPSGCMSFFVTPPDEHSSHWYGLSTRAMLIAQLTGIPTLNGYTSGPPPGWGLSDVYAPDYIARVVAWLDRNKIKEGVCSLSFKNWQWSRFDVGSAPRPIQLEAPLPDSGYQTKLEMIDPPQTMKAGELRTVSVRVTNLGTSTLTGLGTDAVRLSYQWTSADGKTDGYNYRKDIPIALAPGDSVVMSVDLRSPNKPGLYRLDADLVQEFVAWFRNKGGTISSTEISVVRP